MRKFLRRLIGRGAPTVEGEVIEAIAEAEGLDAEDLRIVRAILRLSDLRALELARPWDKVERLAPEATRAEARRAFARSGYSRLPVESAGDPRLLGFLHAKDLLAGDSESESIRSMVRPPLLVPPWRRGDDLLRTLQAEGHHMAFVVHTGGDPIGIVTLEDLFLALWPASRRSASSLPPPEGEAGPAPAVVLEEAAEAGAIEADEAELLRTFLSLRRRPIVEAMVPRTDCDWIEATAGIGEARAQIRASGHSRLVVADGTFDRPVGVVHFRDLLPSPGLSAPRNLAGIATPVLFLPEAMRIDTALSRLHAERRELAIVVDESGGAEGLVTREDLLEELLGEIEDEVNARAPRILPLRRGVYILAGETDLALVGRTTGYRPPEEVETLAQTIAGRIEEGLHRIPSEGDSFTLDGWRFEILRASPTRILRLRMESSPPR